VEALRAFLFGVAVAAPVGPIALLLIHTGLNDRRASALAGAFGVAAADLTYAVLALVCGSVLAPLLHSNQQLFKTSSSVLLLVLGIWLAVSAVRGSVLSALNISAKETRGAVRFYLLTLANPLTILLFAGYSGQMKAVRGWAHIVSYAGCLFLGSLAVQMAYATLGMVLQRGLKHSSSVRAFNAASGLAISGFGLYGLLT
jgi:putative LysE/RhtB family amino acid efflux pump